MNLPLLMAAEPLVIPARNYDRIWIEAVEISAPRPDGDAVARVRLRRFTVDDAGVVHTEPDSQKLEIADSLAKSATDEELATAIQAIMAYIAKAGTEQGVIA
jgi:hypothetical protein